MKQIRRRLLFNGRFVHVWTLLLRQPKTFAKTSAKTGVFCVPVGGSNNANAPTSLTNRQQVEAMKGKREQTSRAARMMVVSWERSPHSARKVRVNAWRKMGEMKLYHLACGAAAPSPASTSAAPLASLDRWSCKHKHARSHPNI